MARAKKRYDLYAQPGLFDIAPDAESSDSASWTPGKVLIEGGGPDSTASAHSVLPPMQQQPDTTLRFMSFGSGSSGNSAYVGTTKCGLLIDAGVDNDTVMKALRANGIEPTTIVGILLTHDHSDHVGYAYNILKHNRHMALFCTPKTFNGLLRRHSISRRIKEYHRALYKETPLQLRDYTVTAFEVSHDGTDNVGYEIQIGHHRFVVATDMGYIGDRAAHYMQTATALMIESDYDEEMLRRGHYPEYLKARIIASRGHLDNNQVADFLRQAWTPGLRHVFLCHLSRDNNTPELAVESARQALLQAGASAVGDASESIETRSAPVQLYALPRFDPSPLFFMR